MASNWPVSILAGPEREGLLQKLGELLRKLPIETSQMTQHYNFVNYSPSEEKVADFGEAGALNNDLEVIFCPQGRQSGPIRLAERGPGLEAIVDVLRRFTRIQWQMRERVRHLHGSIAICGIK